MKGTGAKRNVCPGSCVSTGAKFPVAPVESAPMIMITNCVDKMSSRLELAITDDKNVMSMHTVCKSIMQL